MIDGSSVNFVDILDLSQPQCVQYVHTCNALAKGNGQVLYTGHAWSMINADQCWIKFVALTPMSITFWINNRIDRYWSALIIDRLCPVYTVPEIKVIGPTVWAGEAATNGICRKCISIIPFKFVEDGKYFPIMFSRERVSYFSREFLHTAQSAGCIFQLSGCAVNSLFKLGASKWVFRIKKM